MTLNYRLKTTTRKGTEYFSVDKLTMKMHVDKAKIKATALNPSAQPQGMYILNLFFTYVYIFTQLPIQITYITDTQLLHNKKYKPKQQKNEKQKNNKKNKT